MLDDPAAECDTPLARSLARYSGFTLTGNGKPLWRFG